MPGAAAEPTAAVSAAAAQFLEVAPAVWRELLAQDRNATPAHRPELWEALGAVLPGTRVRLLAVGEGSRLDGAAPIAEERLAGMIRIHAMPWVLPGAPLARPGMHAAVDAAIATALARHAASAQAIGGEWSLYRAHGPEVARPTLEHIPGETTWLETAVMDLGHRPVLHLDRKMRSDLRHARAARLTFHEAPEQLDAAWALYVARSRGWSGHRPLPLELCRRLMAGPDPTGRLFVVEDAGGLMSAAFVLDGAHETLVWWSGTHAEGRSRHAFPFLLASIAEWAAEAGRERVNLGASPGLDAVAAFKRSLGARGVRYPVRWLAPARGGLLSRLAAAAQAFARRGRRRGAAE